MTSEIPMQDSNLHCHRRLTRPLSELCQFRAKGLKAPASAIPPILCGHALYEGL